MSVALAFLGILLGSAGISTMLGHAVASMMPGEPDPVIIGSDIRRVLGWQYALFIWPVLSALGAAAVSERIGVTSLSGTVLGLSIPIIVLAFVRAVRGRRRQARSESSRVVQLAVEPVVKAWVGQLPFETGSPEVRISSFPLDGMTVGNVIIRFPSAMESKGEAIRAVADSLFAQLPTGFALAITVGETVLITRNRQSPPDGDRDYARTRG